MYVADDTVAERLNASVIWLIDFLVIFCQLTLRLPIC